MLMFVLVAATFVAVYWFWIRAVLKSRPAFRELYEREESFLAAARQKFAGIKQKLSSAIVVAASVAVSGYDFIAPIASGVDVSSIAAQVPPHVEVRQIDPVLALQGMTYHLRRRARD